MRARARMYTPIWVYALAGTHKYLPWAALIASFAIKPAGEALDETFMVKMAVYMPTFAESKESQDSFDNGVLSCRV